MVDTKHLEGKVALITGASAGIGRETARTLAADGADIALAARRAERLESIAGEIEAEHDVSAVPIPTDVTDPDAVTGMVETVVERFEELDIAVANASIGENTEYTFDELPVEQFQAVVDVNINGMFYTSRSVIPLLWETDGLLVFVGSFADKFPRSNAPVYAASKWWTRGFARSIAGQLGDDVGVSIVNPSEVRTEFGAAYRDQTNEEKYPPGEVTEPETVAEAIAFAARQEPPDAVTELDLFRRDKLEIF